MWLINTKSLKLEEAVNHEGYQYAILSHTWGGEEVSFQDFCSRELQPAIEVKEGYAKIAKTCELARARGIKYAWVDTCCIDKKSSAELSEAINSMYRWYQDATVCFAYLSDMPPGGLLRELSENQSGDGELQNAFKACRWFSRGWTLQELIAPKDLEFYNTAWWKFGTKSSLGSLIEEITWIPSDILDHRLSLASVAMGIRMSWASARETTRIEDVAYCLMGLFDVNMPMLYGEGHKAFLRLQEEIFRQSSDLSLLAWDMPSTEASQDFNGALAQAPRCFEGCRELEQPRGWVWNQNEVAMTSTGLRIESALLIPEEGGTYLFVDCLCTEKGRRRATGIKIEETTGGYCRSLPLERKPLLIHNGYRQTIYLRKTVSSQESERLKFVVPRLLELCFQRPGRQR